MPWPLSLIFRQRYRPRAGPVPLTRGGMERGTALDLDDIGPGFPGIFQDIGHEHPDLCLVHIDLKVIGGYLVENRNMARHVLADTLQRITDHVVEQ